MLCLTASSRSAWYQGFCSNSSVADNDTDIWDENTEDSLVLDEVALSLFSAIVATLIKQGGLSDVKSSTAGPPTLWLLWSGLGVGLWGVCRELVLCCWCDRTWPTSDGSDKLMSSNSRRSIWLAQASDWCEVDKQYWHLFGMNKICWKPCRSFQYQITKESAQYMS